MPDSPYFQQQINVLFFRSTLVLCPPAEAQEQAKDKEVIDNCDVCKQQISTKQRKAKTINSKANSPQSPTSRPPFNPMHILSDTMYTNVANLQQTMLLQQQLFRQALGHQSTAEIAMKPTPSFTTPSLSQYQFVSGQQVSFFILYIYFFCIKLGIM